MDVRPEGRDHGSPLGIHLTYLTNHSKAVAYHLEIKGNFRANKYIQYSD